jgi:photosystem II stability/assembly factor-like uncharacterized protein
MGNQAWGQRLLDTGHAPVSAPRFCLPALALVATLCGFGHLTEASSPAVTAPLAVAGREQHGVDCQVVDFDRCQAFDEVQSLSVDDVYASDGGCLFRTRDGGRRWDQTFCTEPRSGVEERIYGLDLVSTTEGWMLAYIDLFHSTDGGSTWQMLNSPPRSFVQSVRFANPQIGFWAGGEVAHDNREGRGVLFATQDGGKTWHELDHGVTFPYGWRLRDIWPLTPTDVWAVGDVLLHSIDGGKTWQRVRAHEVWRMDTIRFSTPRVGWIEQYPEKYFLLTVDGGRTWSPRTLPDTMSGHGSLAFIDAKEGWATVNDRIVHTTNGGKRWLPERRCPPSAKAAEDAYYRIEHLKNENVVVATGRCSRAILRGAAVGESTHPSRMVP